MAITFAMRGGSVATYSTYGATASLLGNVLPTTAADTTAPTGNVMIWAANNSAKGAVWPGRTNLPTVGTIAVNMCIRPGYVGTPATSHSFWSIISGSGKFANLEISHNNAGNVIVQAKNESAGLVINSSVWGTYSASSASYTDITFQWDGGANPMRLYVNSTLFGTTITPPSAFTFNWSSLSEICLGTGNLGGVINAGRVAEFTIWNNTFDMAVGVPLTDGTTAPLSGPTRIAAISVSSTIDGAAWTTFNQTAVQNGFVFTAAGVGFTGSYVTVSTANVRSTTTFGPASAYTGIATIPVAAVVIAGTAVDNTTGTYVTVAKTDVRSGTTFGAANSQTGSLATASGTSGTLTNSDMGGWHSF